MNDDRLRLPALPLSDGAAVRIRAAMHREARRARLRAAEAALHGGFALAAAAWACLAAFS